ncbi:MAG: hypothetical protein JW913_08070 [Chitinispirillaceae bacterium]|nr:hypothetical protein [Chitinispirillaceae bacterium]
MLRNPVNVVASALFAFLIGCSGFDSSQIMVHPDSAVVSSTFDMALVNVFMYIDSSTTISNKIERDSLHLLVGMPESWNVVGARFVVVRDLKSEQMLALESGELDDQALAALLQQYQSQAVALPADDALPAAISGRAITAHDQSNEAEVSVDVGDVEVWKGFGAPVDIVYEKGGKPDTVIPLDSAMAFLGESDTTGSDSLMSQIAALEAFGISVPDSIGVCIVPVAMFLKIQAGPQEGDDTLYYFTKTGKMNQAPSAVITVMMPEMADLETGDMVYVPMKLTSAAGVTGSRARFTQSAMKIVADRATGTVRIDLGAVNLNPPSINIFSLQGNLVRTLTPAAPAAGSIVWDGADARGNRVGSGSYLVRIAGDDGSMAHRVQLVR